MATIFGGGVAIVVESLLLDLPLSPLPLREVPCVVESLLPLRLDSPEPLLLSELGTITVVDSLRDHNLATSARKSEIPVACESLLDFELELLIPESALDSRLFRTEDTILELWSVVDCLPHGRLLARSAKVSLLYSGALFLAFAEPPPPHSLKMSVSWASELLRRRVAPPVAGGEVSWISVGGEMLCICVAESLRPPNLCRMVDSSTCSRTKSSQPFPPCHTKPTWWDRMGRLQTKQIAVIVLKKKH